MIRFPALPSSIPVPGLVCLALLVLCPAAGAADSRPERSADPDAVVEAAAEAIRSGRPWRATELLDSLFRTPGTRTPRALLVAAEAAAGWGGWQRVEALLDGARWLDSLGGQGHVLLARAALESGRLSVALRHGQRALVVVPAGQRLAPLVSLGRTWDRMERRDSAAWAYQEAAAQAGDLADWLTLRAAGVTDDPARRMALVAGVRHPAARARIPWTEALARDRAGQWLEAARLYDSLGERVNSLRIRLEATPPADRASLRSELIALLPALGSDASRTAIGLADRLLAPLTAAEQAAIARRAAVVGTAERAVTGFRAAERAGLLTDEDRFRYGSALARTGQHAAGIAQFERVADPAWAGQAAYQAARTRMLSGRTDLAIPALRQVASRWRQDTEAAGTALYLLGDLLTDRGDETGAREAFLQLGRQHPGNRYAPTARLRAALAALRAGQHATAARELDSLRIDGGREAHAATYWAGRAWTATGDTTTARTRYRQAAAGSDEYYAILAARALGQTTWQIPAQRQPAPGFPGLAAAVGRSDRLAALGLRVESRQEYDWAVREAGRTAESLLAAALVLDSLGRPERSVRFAIRAQGQGARTDSTLARLVFPFPWREPLLAEAALQRLDPLLIISLIRQESAFDPGATSSAGARGLMQVMPAVGTAEARRIPIEEFDPVLLWQPEVSLRLGTRHLRETLARFPVLEHALAAYNAGASRVARWLETPGVASDPALFVERIPIVETRDYVRRVMINLERYRALYPQATATP